MIRSEPFKYRFRPASPDAGWEDCRSRAAAMFGNPWVFVPWLAGVVLGAAYSILGFEEAGLYVSAALAAAALAFVGGGNIKFWVALYPVVFLAPGFRIGELAEGGDKLFGVQLYEPLIAVMAVLWMPNLLASKRLELSKAVKALLAVLFILGLNAVRIAPDLNLALRVGGRVFFEPILLFVIITSLRWSLEELKRVAVLFILAGTVTAMVSLYGYLSGGGGQGGQGLVRLFSYWGATNVQAAFLCILIPVTIGAAFSSQNRGVSALYAISLVTACAALVFTFTRGSWLAIAVGLAIMVAMLRAWGWAAVVFSIAGVLLLLGPPWLLERAESIIYFDQDPSASNRLVLWNQVLRLIWERPLTGYGFAGFITLFGLQSEYHSIHAHNLLLDIAVNTGVPMLMAFLSLLAYVLKRGFQAVTLPGAGAPMLLGLWAGSAAVISAGLFDGSILAWPVLSHAFWFVLALTYAMSTAVLDGRGGR